MKVDARGQFDGAVGLWVRATDEKFAFDVRVPVVLDFVVRFSRLLVNICDRYLNFKC